MDKIVLAKAKYNRTSPQKARLVIDLIRGKLAEEAQNILKFTNKAVASDILKVLNSAVRNASFNNEMDKTDLIVKKAYIDEAPTYKRGKAVARGRYHQILKRNCHIIIGVSEKIKKNIEKKKVIKPVDKKSKQVNNKTENKIKKLVNKKNNSNIKNNK